MATRPYIRFGLIVLLAAFALSGCKSGGGSSTAGTTTTTNTDLGALPTVAGGSTPATLWSRYFVKAYDMAKVMAERNSPAFTNSTVTYSLTIPGNPTFNSGGTATSNALLDAHLDYALSTGLTGTGVTLGMIDSEVDTTHVQFAGKSATLDGATGSAQFHGTAVASVMLGNGNDGEMTGFAPRANLYAGTIDYTTSLDWAQIGGYMQRAKTLGAVAVNNSWGLLTPSGADATVANTDAKTEFSSGSRATYLADVRSYAQSGVVVFAAQNDYNATSISTLAGLPQAFPDLKTSWIAVINAIPQMNGDTIVSANRISAPCAEAATYCLTANGQTRVADNSSATAYTVGGGASFAAPQVTGALGLLAEAFPDLTPQQLRDRLLVTAENRFFTPTGTVTFAPGVVHGYNQEFGMGFLDLKAALLPIGNTSIPTASGTALPTSQPVIASSTASGNAVASALSRTRLVVLDQMGGNFTAPASNFAAAPAKLDMASLRLGVLTSPGAAAEAGSYANALRSGAAEAMLDHTDLMATPDAARLFAGATDRRVAWRGTRLSIIRDADRLTGIGVSQDIPAGAGALRLGVTGFIEQGGVLGVSAPGYSEGMSATAATLKVSYAAPIAKGVSLRAEGEFGLADGKAGGMISSIGTLGYNRVGLSLDEADVGRAGDVLTLFARTPVAITSGAATLALPVAYSLTGPSFEATPVPLRPSAREVNLGFEYSRPLNDNVLIRGGVSYAVNAGNIAGAHSVDAALGLTVRF